MNYESVKAFDIEIYEALSSELRRQQTQIELIASENIVSEAVLEACGSVLTNKYAEGYSGARYYGGCECVDIAENLAIERAKKLFNVKFVNVQPHSGAQANTAVMYACLKPGDTFFGMSLDAGGHLTHGAKPTVSGKWFNAVQYGVRPDNFLIDYEELAKMAEINKPKLIIAGGSAYPRAIDFKKFREICDNCGALLMVDMAHFAGIVAGGLHDNPCDYADVVTTTTHKTLRGPRGGMILTNNEELAKKINSAVFPGTQGGPLMHIISAKAVAFKEALQPSYKEYIKNVVNNAKVLAETLENNGVNIITGGTDTHLMLVDLRSKNVTGRDACISLEKAHITANKNGIPFDPTSPKVTSGLRFGSPAATTRGFGAEEFKKIGEMIAKVIDGLSLNGENNQKIEQEVKEEVLNMCENFPIYKNF
ncbi:MAG: Serine hydroxymethyltransferase 2 [Alphaproteobacteria bacterium ADurb.Bin438]|nr:MAG: Serine hydroxymethyltransferase 2 [Alphaproteobacteria bacterium ADurb.Bin438]